MVNTHLNYHDLVHLNSLRVPGAFGSHVVLATSLPILVVLLLFWDELLKWKPSKLLEHEKNKTSTAALQNAISIKHKKDNPPTAHIAQTIYSKFAQNTTWLNKLRGTFAQLPSYLLRLAHDRKWTQFFMFKSALFRVEDSLAWNRGQVELAVGHVDLGSDCRKWRRFPGWRIICFLIIDKLLFPIIRG